LEIEIFQKLPEKIKIYFTNLPGKIEILLTQIHDPQISNQIDATVHASSMIPSFSVQAMENCFHLILTDISIF